MLTVLWSLELGITALIMLEFFLESEEFCPNYQNEDNAVLQWTKHVIEQKVK